MTNSRAPPLRRNTAWTAFVPALAVTVLVGLALYAILPATPLGPPSGGWTGSGTWTNGLLALQAEPDHPAVTVSSGGNATPWGLYAGVASLSELRPDGTAVAAADLEGATWAVTNTSAGPTLNLAYSTAALVTGLSGPSGTVDVFVNFTAGPGSEPDSSVTSVGFSVAIVGWPWAHPEDGIALAMPIWPNSTDAAILRPVPGIAGTIDCRSAASGMTFETFRWSSTATVIGPAGSSTVVDGSTQLVGDSNLTTVTVVFGGAASGAHVVRYDPAILVPGLATASTLPLVDYAYTVGAALGLVGLAVTAVVWVGRRPPSMLYAE